MRRKLVELLLLTSLTTRRSRGSGRNHTGKISIWGRHSRVVTQGVGGLALDYWLGFVRVWQTRLVGWVNHRGVHVGLAVDQQGSLGYLRLSAGIKRGDYLQATVGACLPRLGSTLPLRWVPVGTEVNSVSFYGRSPGVSLKILRHRNNFTECRLPSRRTCWINSLTFCRIGTQGNSLVRHLVYGKAGQNFWLGSRPHVRGVAMNPIDHPHGGGQGKTSGGRPGVTPWGRLTKGAKTVIKVSRSKSLRY